MDVDKVPDFVKNFLDAEWKNRSKQTPHLLHQVVMRSVEKNLHLRKLISLKNASEREVLLRSYIERLTKGRGSRDCKKRVRTELQKKLMALEIANAEQHLIKSGVPYQEVQKLVMCILHYSTVQLSRKIMNAEKAVAASKEAAQRRMMAQMIEKRRKLRLRRLSLNLDIR